MISEEQSREIKNQIIQHIESTFPEDKKDSAKQQVESMNSEKLEEFLEKNNLMRGSQNSVGEGCIFCLIASEKTQSHKIDGNKTMAAFLEINPVSKGHILIIPKKHSDKTSKSTIAFAEKISRKIKSKLNPKKVITSSGNLFGHGIINVIPVYKNESLSSERYKAEKEELEEVQKILAKKIIRKPRTKKISEKIWLPKRIP